MLTPLLERLYDWLSPAAGPAQGDLIFVLAGRQSRRLYALELYRQGAAGGLLLSVGRFEIRKFDQLPLPAALDLKGIAGATPPALRHYFVHLQGGQATVERIECGRLGTLSEIRALAGWLRARPQVGTLLVVSSAPHLRRVRTCCRALLPPSLRLSFLAVPEGGDWTRSGWWCDRKVRALVLKELPKLALYRAALIVSGGYRL
jgi:uncharacterized SAM-binding protein YcdF (DUF218 family)